MGLLDVLDEIMRAKGPRPQNAPENYSSLIPQEDAGGLLGRAATMSAPIPVVGDVMGLLNDAQMYRTKPEQRTPGNFALTALGALPFVPSMAGVMTYHGTPHKFDKYDLSKVGTGQGAQSYGHGVYFGEAQETGQSYRDILGGKEVRAADGTLLSMAKPPAPGPRAEANARSFLEFNDGRFADAIHMAKLGAITDPKLTEETVQMLRQWDQAGAKLKPAGSLYKQDLPDEVLTSLLQWDRPLKDQPEKVQGLLLNKLSELSGKKVTPEWVDTFGKSGESLYALMSAWTKHAPEMTAKAFREAGIPGLSYLDAGSRGSGKGTRNHVIWDQGLLDRMKPIPVE